MTQYNRTAMLLMAFFLMLNATCYAEPKSMTLWPNKDIAHSLLNQQTLSTALRKRADKAVRLMPAPIKSLRSAGVVDKNSSELKASRRAFRDADNAAVAALAYVAFGEIRYLNYVKNVLLSWSKVNIPTGHPIDETRLEGLLWAFDLVSTELSNEDALFIRDYFRAMLTAKRHWKFGPKTKNNNHKTHHLKMLILLDRILNDQQAMAMDLADVRAHLGINLDKQSGVSIDYIERDALYYHVYNLEAWLEIALLTECCIPEVRAAFRFTADQLLSNKLDGEFLHSQAPIDQQRGRSNFEYAKRNSRFNVKRAARSILSYSTITRDPLAPKLQRLVQDRELEKKLSFFFVRRLLWQKS